MLCAIWYYLYKLKNVKNTHGGVLLLVKFTKSNTRPWVFFRFFKLCKWHQIAQSIAIVFVSFEYLENVIKLYKLPMSRLFRGILFFIKLCLYSKLLKENYSHFPLAENFSCKLPIQPMKLLHLDLHGNFSFGGNCTLE